MKSLENTTIEHFKSHFQGDVVLPTDSNYDEVRQIWNGMIDRKPSLIARCKSTDDVVMAVNFARDNGQLLSVRGGGHNIAGNAVCDNGVMIDLSLLTQVRVDENAKRAFVEPGCTLGDLDEATQKHGLATPVGINSTTGIAGLTLGGGFGWLSRKYGMTIDNLVSVTSLLPMDANCLPVKKKTRIFSGRCAEAAVILASLRSLNSNCIP